MTIDIRQLQTLVTVIEKGSLGLAAEALNISQPALTKSIQRLEERLGVPLFYRESKGMRPTIYGEALRAHAVEISTGFDQALREIDALKSGSEGTVRVAAGPLMTSEILTAATVMLMRDRPGIKVSIHTAIGDQTDALMTGRYDFVLMVLPFGQARAGTSQHTVYQDKISVIARADNALTKMKRVTPRDLLANTWVLPEAGHNHRKRFESVFEADNLPTPQPAIECSSTDFMRAVVRQTNHLGLIAHMGLSRGDRFDSEIAEVNLASPFLVRPIGVVWRERQVLSRSSRLLIEAIETVCKSPSLFARS